MEIYLFFYYFLFLFFAVVNIGNVGNPGCMCERLLVTLSAYPSVCYCLWCVLVCLSASLISKIACSTNCHTK